MKKIYLFAFVVFTVNAFSQIISPSDGNIFYYNGLADVTFKFAPRGLGGRAFVHADNNVLALNFQGDFTGGTTIGNNVYFNDSGNSYILSDKLGIGTYNPISKLSVDGSLTLSGGLTNNLSRPLISSGTLVNGEIRGYSASGNAYDDGFLRLSAGGGTNSFVKSYIDLSGYSTVPDMNRNIVFGTDGTERMRIITNGNIGIGIKDPTNKLDVNGTIHSKEVKVDMNGWSDFVFKKEYDLARLEEVEKHIAENGHLENIPSEEEVLKNGINLGEMNSKLLQKIEELTLYVIKQNKQITDLQSRLEKIETNSK